MIYLDNNATTKISTKVKEAMHALEDLPLNPSSIHSYGRKARILVESARESIAKFVGAKNHKVIFTASGTESNNLAIQGLVKYKLVVSAIEHASILKIGKHIHTIPVSADGIIDTGALKRLLRQYQNEKLLVSTMMVNNETGVIQPIKEISEIVHEFGGILHIDAVQAAGKIDINIEDLNVDLATISSHKIYGPKGAAALVCKKNIELSSIIKGGSQENGYRAGTENVLAIHGFKIAAQEATHNLNQMQKLESIRDYIETVVQDYCKDAVVFGKNVPRVANTSLIAMPYVTSETQLIHFDIEKIALSNGSACASGKVSNSHVLAAMGVKPEFATSTIRISLGIENTMDEATKFIDSWKKLYDRANTRKAA